MGVLLEVGKEGEKGPTEVPQKAHLQAAEATSAPRPLGEVGGVLILCSGNL